MCVLGSRTLNEYDDDDDDDDDDDGISIYRDITQDLTCKLLNEIFKLLN